METVLASESLPHARNTIGFQLPREELHGPVFAFGNLIVMVLGIQLDRNFHGPIEGGVPGWAPVKRSGEATRLQVVGRRQTVDLFGVEKPGRPV